MSDISHVKNVKNSWVELGVGQTEQNSAGPVQSNLTRSLDSYGAENKPKVRTFLILRPMK